MMISCLKLGFVFFLLILLRRAFVAGDELRTAPPQSGALELLIPLLSVVYQEWDLQATKGLHTGA